MAALIPAVALGLALSWVWKSNQVKDYYRGLKKLETERTNLVSENMRLRVELTELKSRSRIDAVVTREFGLTLDVSERIILTDPVAREKKPSRLEFASGAETPDWLETAIVGSGRIRADQPECSKEEAY
jgi:cell division protein FtsL